MYCSREREKIFHRPKNKINKSNKYKVYDAQKSKYLFELEERGKYIACKNECIKYLDEYPNDISVICLLANCSRKIGDFEFARVLMDKVNNKKEELDSDAYYASSELGLLIREKNFEKAYQVLMDNYQNLYSKGAYVELLELYLLKKLGFDLPEDTSKDSYQCKQIREYSEERCLEHIQKHFVEDFDLQGLIDLVKEKKKDAVSYYPSTISEICYFKYSHIGNYSTDCKSDIIKVIFFSGTDKIISMYSSYCNDRFEALDITPIKEKEHVKKLSRIDKFNNKYYL